MSRLAILVLIAFVLLAGAAFVVGFSKQASESQENATTKLTFGNTEIAGTSSSDIAPIVVSSKRLLVPVGDVLYMLNADKQIVWEYSVEPNVFYDVRSDANGRIYLAISDGVFRVLEADGNEVWGHFMNGSAQYSQIAPYRDGVIVVVNMDGYRERHTPGDYPNDHVQYWQNEKMVWSKKFPQKARLEVLGEKVLAVKQTKEGKEVTEIR